MVSLCQPSLIYSPPPRRFLFIIFSQCRFNSSNHTAVIASENNQKIWQLSVIVCLPWFSFPQLLIKSLASRHSLHLYPSEMEVWREINIVVYCFDFGLCVCIDHQKFTAVGAFGDTALNLMPIQTKRGVRPGAHFRLHTPHFSLRLHHLIK